MMILPLLSLKPSSCQALLYNTIGVTLFRCKGARTDLKIDPEKLLYSPENK